MIKKNIPNIITLSNLSFGVLAITNICLDNFSISCYFIFIAGLLDFLDGFLARLLKVSSEMGKQLDSLADMISFGIAPSIIIFYALIHNNSTHIDLSFIIVLIPICSAIRLARFNIDNNQKYSFSGLPTPANAMFLASLCLFNYNTDIILNYYLMILLIIITSILLISRIKFFSLKFINYNISDNSIKYIFILSSILIIITSFLFNKFSISIALIILLYIVLSLIVNLIRKIKT
jgi:CDP-diacylglycerol---serine O-phosphatidyltransferase